MHENITGTIGASRMWVEPIMISSFDIMQLMIIFEHITEMVK